MSKFERVLSDVELTIAINDGCTADLFALAERVEQAVLAKLAEQEPAGYVAKAPFDADYFKYGDGINLYKKESHLLSEFSKATPIPLYAHPCVSPTSDKTACVSESEKSETQKNVTEEYKRFCDWCDANPSFDLDSRLHTSGGTIDNGGYISDEKTRIAFAAWRAAKKALVAAPKYTGEK